MLVLRELEFKGVIIGCLIFPDYLEDSCIAYSMVISLNTLVDLHSTIFHRHRVQIIIVRANDVQKPEFYVDPQHVALPSSDLGVNNVVNHRHRAELWFRG